MPVTAGAGAGAGAGNGWTGGQYSVSRAALGSYLFVHFLTLLPWGAEVFSRAGALPDAAASPFVRAFPNVLALWDSPAFVTAFLAAGAALAVLLVAGWADRVAALLLWYVWACLFGRNPLVSNPGLPYVGWMLLAHALTPGAPYGSLARRGRPDPGAAWTKPLLLQAGAWALMALGYTYGGWTKLASPSWLDGTAVRFVLESPLARDGWLRAALLALPAPLLQLATWTVLALELLFAPLALLRRLRPWLWSLLLGLHLALLLLVDFPDLTLGMVLLHFYTFDPAWVPGLRAGVQDRVFYDGHCGLCHRAVRFIVAEDRGGTRFRLSPLDSDAFRAAVPEHVRRALPDSIVVRTAEGVLLSRSAAILHVGRRLGGLWRVAAALVALLPLSARDAAYDFIASIRYRLFGRPADACPIAPPELRARFDL